MQEKVLKAYVRMKEKTAKRNKRRKNISSKWKPQVGDLVLAKCQAVSDAVDGITKKFVRPYNGPWKITQVINPTTYEVANEQGKIKTVFNQKAIKPYLTSMELKKYISVLTAIKVPEVIPCLCIISGLWSCKVVVFYNIRLRSKIE